MIEVFIFSAASLVAACVIATIVRAYCGTISFIKLMTRPIMEITVVCGEDRETAIYADGVFQPPEDGDNAYEIARITDGQPCRVTTRNPVGWQCGSRWPMLLSDIPAEDAAPPDFA